jgi:uncharacterized membrane protein YsdA (DUF1294 family)/cold shock CspA family protein
MRFDGRLKTWNDDRGFGFIEPLQGGDDVFVHIKAFADLRGRPAVGQRLSFDVELGPQGKKRATRVEPVRPAVVRQRRAESPAQWGTATLFAIPAFVVLYGAVALLWKPPLLVAAAYVVASLVTFVAYGLDKQAAARDGWRTSESTLHLLALAGGWPGALLAQQFLRHKSTKTAFRAVFWATVVLNVLGLIVLCSPIGRGLWDAAQR